MEKLNTPLMNQYYRIKSQYPNEILFFRMGDFYEMFGEDARIASGILGIALTSRSHGKSEKIPLAGVPHHAAERYISRLIKAGRKVVICEQVEDPKKAKGIVKRDVVEIITPGTITIDNIIDKQSNNFLASLTQGKENMGLAFIDLTTGEFKIDQDTPSKILERIFTIWPAEILLPEQWTSEKIKKLKLDNEKITITQTENWRFSHDFAYRTLTEHFKSKSLEGFGCEKMELGIAAAGAALSYLNQTKKSSLEHITRITPVARTDQMFLDSTTLRNLEIFYSMGTGDKKNTLFFLLNRTQTPMGSRKLKNWIARPLLDPEAIQKRHDAVEELAKDKRLSQDLSKKLERIMDLERITGKLGYGKANPKDVIGLKESLKIMPEMIKVLGSTKSELLQGIRNNVPQTADLVGLVEKSICDDPPMILTEAGIIKKGYDKDLDDMKDEITFNRQWIAGLQKKERERTKIPSLKVGFNKVFGYFIEITKPHLSKVPQDYIRKQTMVNAERFITPELKQKEEIILGAEEKIAQIEYELFLDIRSKVAQRTEDIQKTADLVATLDVLLSFRQMALDQNYTRPEIDLSEEIIIEDGRHPVVEKILEGEFVPNDTKVGRDQKIHVITGPNMAGKSTYLRQVGLIVLMAQMGSFVPAKKAKIGIVDRIFTRVGALDNIALGQSTFLMEMAETANILNNATPKSLILLDEIGRGTSTFDGLSIAWAVTEFIHNNPGLCCRTLVATHYHELTELAKFLPQVKNFNVAVKEWEDEVIFLRKIVPGGCDDSYGIHVAKLAGVPREVLDRAKHILIELEQGELSYERLPRPKQKPVVQQYQLSIFSPRDNQIAQELKKIDTNKLTPIEALNKLNELKKKAEESE
jgi:DNA mismatch repair protein MutS